MDRQLHAAIMLGAPLAAIAVACVVLFVPHTPKFAVAPASLEHCRRAAELLFDVHWATACAAAGDTTTDDCMLPENQAKRMNAILATEEARCLAAETQNMVSW